ncbi:MAG: primosomal protein N' [Dehalococcoidia bacterium]|nr:primosomal protein N' [Dehalococcoidia bacterium]
MPYAEVAVDAPVGVEHTFSYAIPTALSLAPGDVVSVPFGPRLLPGVVFEITPFPQVPGTRAVAARLAPAPLLQAHQLQLARWLSRYYQAPLFTCAVPMLPPDFRGVQRAFLSLASDVVMPADVPAEELLLVDRVRGSGREEERVLVRGLGREGPQQVERLLRKGWLQRHWEVQPPRGRPKLVEHLQAALSEASYQEALAGLRQSRASRQQALLEAMRPGSQPQPAASLRKEYGAAGVAALLAKGYLRRVLVRQERDPLAGQTFPQDAPLNPTPEQRRALKAIVSRMDAPEGPGVFLLHGVTGSGKTEVYLQAIAHCIAKGKRALVLVPEIALTPQMVQRFAARFPGRVTVLHSGLSPGERFDLWWSIREGRHDVVIGPRGALFAPLTDLGLIVLDEEHEWSYKQQEQGPLYHAREAAVHLGELTGAVVVLGSATPDVVTYERAQRGQYLLLGLPYRVGEATGGEAPQAHVEVVDMRRELKEGNRSIFSKALQEALDRCLQGGHQGILFLNRRGASSSVQCRNCGLALRCRRCDIALTYHSVEVGLVCHQCNRRSPVPAACPRCKSPRIRFLGLGTQRLVEEVQVMFPGARVLRWDRDAAAYPKAHQEINRRFQEGEADLLVGTQMLAKGLHFPRVTLVGALLADIGLNTPDFRAAERAFQVLCQVAGRAGRGAEPGRVVIQTYNPDHYAIKHAAAQDFQGFYRQEMAFRQQQRLPPFSRLVRLEYHHSNEDRCRATAQGLARALANDRDAQGEVVDILGPVPAYPSRVRGRYRWRLLLRGSHPEVLLKGRELPQGWTVDVDPQTTA